MTESYMIGAYRVTIVPPDARYSRWTYAATGPDWWATSGHADTEAQARADVAQFVASRTESRAEVAPIPEAV